MPPVAIVGPYSSGALLIDAVRDAGHEPVILTGGRSNSGLSPADLRRCERIVRIDTDDVRAVEAKLVSLHRERRLAAIVPGFEDQVPVASRAARALGLHGLPREVSLRVRFKDRMRLALARAGIEQPRFRIVRAPNDAAAAVAAVGLPCVVKPVGRSGSAGVRKAGSLAEAAAALVEILGRAQRERAGTADDSPPDPDGAALVEEYIPGPEYSVEGYVESGEPVIIGITNKLLGAEPCFVEIGHIFPADVPEAAAHATRRYVAAVVRALRISLGPFHAEVRLSTRGPLLMEVAGRLPGDRIPRLVSLTQGIDLARIMVNAYLGLPPTDAARSPAAVCAPSAGVQFFLRPGLSRYRSATVSESLARDPALRELSMLIAPGARVPPPDSSRGRLGYAIVTGERQDEVRRMLARADRCVTFTPAVHQRRTSDATTHPRHQPRRQSLRRLSELHRP
jgi:biotin carboxylase